MNSLNTPNQYVESIVYHCLGNWPSWTCPIWPFDYQVVAHVRASNLEEVYRLTQQVELNKHEQALVRWIEREKPHRSTMINDVVWLDDGETRELWRCTFDSWEIVPDDL